MVVVAFANLCIGGGVAACINTYWSCGAMDTRGIFTSVSRHRGAGDAEGPPRRRQPAIGDRGNEEAQARHQRMRGRAARVRRERGSSPIVALYRCRILVGLTVQPSLTWWQVSQLRPFLPSCWKKGLVRSISPARPSVADMPVAFRNTKSSGPCRSSAPAVDTAADTRMVGVRRMLLEAAMHFS